MEQQYLTRKQAAQLLQVDTRTIDRWIKQDILHAIKLGSTVRIPRTEIPSYVKTKVQESLS